jgi:hypothetical protein
MMNCSHSDDGWCLECVVEQGNKLEKAERLLERIAKANVIFPSMCANNMEAWNITEELKPYRSTDIGER